MVQNSSESSELSARRDRYVTQPLRYAEDKRVPPRHPTRTGLYSNRCVRRSSSRCCSWCSHASPLLHARASRVTRIRRTSMRTGNQRTFIPRRTRMLVMIMTRRTHRCAATTRMKIAALIITTIKSRRSTRSLSVRPSCNPRPRRSSHRSPSSRSTLCAPRRTDGPRCISARPIICARCAPVSC